jgi:hypothetical protein
METEQHQRQSGGLNSRGGTGLAIVIAVVLLIRVPFLNQAIQGDDHIYLTEAQHALIDPTHPLHVKYVFQGNEVDLRGHSHPPLNAWVLAGLLAAFGDVREIPFHAAYIVFSLIAAWAMWSLARCFSPQPLWATLLFVAVPAFVVNGNSLESDLPFLAFWMAAIALFSSGRLALSALSMVLAAMAAYQAVLLTPILAVYVWLYRRRDRSAWLTLLVPPVVVLAWQLFERLSTGAMPAAVLNGYFSSYGFQALDAKLRSALALTIHSWFLVFPALVPAAALLAWRKRREPDTRFLLSWIAIFFVGALAIFFAGSARYLLPMAAPVALLASRLRPKWLAAGFAAQMALSLGLAIVNYQHWDGYRRFAKILRAPDSGHRVWVDDEWGLRFYVESDGGLPLTGKQPLRAGDIVVSSELAHPVAFTAPTAPIATAEIRPAIPLRLIGLESHSGYSTAAKGFWPFGISTGPIDRVRADLVVERRPTLEYLPMNAPQASEQIVSGIYQLEGGNWRWMSGRAILLLKSPGQPLPVKVRFSIPPVSPARRVTLLLEDREIVSQAFPGPGSYTLETRPQAVNTATSTLTIVVDRVFSVPGDARQLGIVLTEAGFER